MTTNQIDFDRVLQTVYAVSALGTLTGDPQRQCPPGDDESAALLELTDTEFATLCEELGAPRADRDTVELPAAVNRELEQVVTDRVMARIYGRAPRPELLAGLKRKLKPIPKHFKKY